MATFISAPHPFPARMAPDLALSALKVTVGDGIILDPMCGSGTVLRSAAQYGHDAIGFDVDPLAVIMARVWTANIDPDELLLEADRVVRQATDQAISGVRLPWIDDDHETTAFIEYWFAPSQRRDLRLLASVLNSYDGILGDALKLCLSRIIITKDRGASLARDVSHSRPHRVAIDNDYDVLLGFTRAAAHIARRIKEPVLGKVTVSQGDARDLTSVRDNCIAQVVTSPPYLNAIDYLRGHRLALVWLGYRFGDLREIRGTSIGAERGLSGISDVDIEALLKGVAVEKLPSRTRGMVNRYAHDLHHTLSEIWRVLQPGAHAVMVVGNSTVRGVYIENSDIVRRAAESLGFVLKLSSERDLPAARRYLPPPTSAATGSLGSRMRSEVILDFMKPA